jgi:hypothetical protein
MLSPRLKFYEGWAIKRSDKPPSASANPDAPRNLKVHCHVTAKLDSWEQLFFAEKAAATPIAYFLLAGKYRLTISPSWFNC